MTIRDLKYYLNSVDEKYLDENILFIDGYGIVLDLDADAKNKNYKNPQSWIDKDIEI